MDINITNDPIFVYFKDSPFRNSPGAQDSIQLSDSSMGPEIGKHGGTIAFPSDLSRRIRSVCYRS